ncbi:hypothetical protein E2C01_078770 [Portunus trituberculatus]|uniref:Uncharacterized protein n=1 Tax=Portunus trituberculatus TaxID=210409 RepID=A0A5B7IR15_PORTR|nr:hypothetical protein [Portunus trituberculatus]
MYVHKAEFCLTIQSDGSVRLAQTVLGDAAVRVEIVLRQVVDHQPHVGLIALLLGGGLVPRASWWEERERTRRNDSESNRSVGSVEV